MKKIALLTAVICLCMSSFAQKTAAQMQYDPMLYQMVPADQIERMLEDAPSKLADINFDLTHFAYVDSNLPADCIMMNEICTYVSPDKTCSDAEILSSKKFNRFYYAIPTDPTRYEAFPIGNSGFYVIVLPSDEFAKQKREYMRKLGY